jgi:hypothetical protein
MKIEAKLLRQFRKALVKLGVSPDKIAEADKIATGADKRLLKRLPKTAITRVLKMLAAPGDRVIIVRAKTGVRVFTPEGLKSLSSTAKKHQPWKKSGVISKTAKQALAAAIPAIV